MNLKCFNTGLYMAASQPSDRRIGWLDDKVPEYYSKGVTEEHTKAVILKVFGVPENGSNPIVRYPSNQFIHGR